VKQRSSKPSGASGPIILEMPVGSLLLIVMKLRLSRESALIAVIVGAVGSAGLTIYAGRRNSSLLLVTLFLGWVLSPFIALAWAHAKSRHWAGFTRATLHWLMLVVAVASPLIYGLVALGPARVKPAFVFVVVPPVSWLLIAAALAIAARISGRQQGRLPT
jgi:hypothetical protein